MFLTLSWEPANKVPNVGCPHLSTGNLFIDYTLTPLIDFMLIRQNVENHEVVNSLVNNYVTTFLIFPRQP